MRTSLLVVVGMLCVPLVACAQTVATSAQATSTTVSNSTSTDPSVTPVASSTVTDLEPANVASSLGSTLEDRPYPYISGPHCLRFTRNLSIGSRGSDVLSLQRELVQLGFLTATSTSGYFGVLTQAAVMQMQAAYNISSSTTGAVGPLTRAFFTLMCPAISTEQSTSSLDISAASSSDTSMTTDTAAMSVVAQPSLLDMLRNLSGVSTIPTTPCIVASSSDSLQGSSSCPYVPTLTTPLVPTLVPTNVIMQPTTLHIIVSTSSATNVYLGTPTQ